MTKQNKYCAQCPMTCGIPRPSPQAIDSLYSDDGCAWFIKSADHNFCFWEYAKTLDAPVPDKEICQLLGLTQAELRSTYESAIKKLKENSNSPEFKEFTETVLELAANRERDPVMPAEVVTSIGVAVSQEEVEEEAIKPKRKIKNGVTHRDGKKKDIWGIYSKAKLQQMADEKKGKKK